jgi:hypothetical protein
MLRVIPEDAQIEPEMDRLDDYIAPVPHDTVTAPISTRRAEG